MSPTTIRLTLATVSILLILATAFAITLAFSISATKELSDNQQEMAKSLAGDLDSIRTGQQTMTKSIAAINQQFEETTNQTDAAEQLKTEIDALREGLQQAGSSSGHTIIPKWKEGTSAQKAQEMLIICLSNRFGVANVILQDFFTIENFEELLKELDITLDAQSRDWDLSDVSIVRFLGGIVGCWE